MKKIKTLRDLLEEPKYRKVNVKIGSIKGSSFWYCGKGDKLFALPEIQKARKKTLAQNQHQKARLLDRLKNLDEYYELAIAKQLKKGAKNPQVYVEKMNKKKERERLSLPKLIALVQEDIDIHLLDRPVKAIYDGVSPDEKPCYIIYVKGMERGQYWTIKEYLAKRKKDDEEE